jgi:hypothetical protein
MERLKQYGLVRVRLLLQPAMEYDDWRVNQRPPQVGDVGTCSTSSTPPACPIGMWSSHPGRAVSRCGSGTSRPKSWRRSANKRSKK